MADYQFFHDFIFTNGSAKSSGTAMGSWFFQGVKFHEWSISVKFACLEKPTIQCCDALGMMHQYCTLHCPSNCYTVKFCCCDMFNVLINAHRIVGTGLEYWCSIIWIQKVGLQ